MCAALARGLTLDRDRACNSDTEAGSWPLRSRTRLRARGLQRRRRLRPYRRRAPQSRSVSRARASVSTTAASSPSSAAEATATAPNVRRWAWPPLKPATSSSSPATIRAASDPSAIIEEIIPGVRETNTPLIVEEDRRTAIERAIRSAQPGDIVLLAGKGHEKVQVFAEGAVPFDDVAEASRVLQQLAEVRA